MIQHLRFNIEDAGFYSSEGAMDTTKPDRVAVVKVKDLAPETFLVLTGRSRPFTTGYLWTTSLELTERELRDELAQTGRSIAESDALVIKARANPV